MAREEGPGGGLFSAAPRWAPILAAGGIIAAALAAYYSSFSGSFVFLDGPAIRDNFTIRSLWPIARVLTPPAEGGVTVGGRPIVNLSLAVNYAISGMRIGSYHAANLLIHILAGLTLFGIVRRTLGKKLRDRGRRTDGATFPAFSIALLWTVHPLQTESVTYIIQRAESLMGLFYFLTLYGFIRMVGNERFSPPWGAASVLACALGMATKEVMVSAPVIVLLYDRTFISGRFSAAWRARRGYYGALACTWLPLAWLVAGTGGNRGGTSGFGLSVSWGGYLLTQGPAILHYLKLALWPSPLVFYYAVEWVHGAAAWFETAIVALLFVGALFALRHPTALGFLGMWFFSVLAPTSLIPGLSQTMAEHRMYVALAPVVAVAVLALDGALKRWSPGLRPWLLAGVVLAAAGIFGSMTAERNGVYRSELTLWSDTVAKAPANPYTQNNLGIALADAGRLPEAIGHFTRALQLNPDYAEAHDNLGLALASEGRLSEAIGRYEQALKLKRNYPEARTNLGVALAGMGRMDEAIAQFQRALQLAPDNAGARNNLAAALASSRRLPEAIVEYERVLQRTPDNSETHYNLANAFAQAGRWEEAFEQYRQALRLRPTYPEASANLGAALAQLGRVPEAVAQYERALALSPNDPDVHYNLGLALRSLGRLAEANAHFERAARIRSGR